jgi:hypothetical protein
VGGGWLPAFVGLISQYSYRGDANLWENIAGYFDASKVRKWGGLVASFVGLMSSIPIGYFRCRININVFL